MGSCRRSLSHWGCALEGDRGTQTPSSLYFASWAWGEWFCFTSVPHHYHPASYQRLRSNGSTWSWTGTLSQNKPFSITVDCLGYFVISLGSWECTNVPRSNLKCFTWFLKLVLRGSCTFEDSFVPGTLAYFSSWMHPRLGHSSLKFTGVSVHSNQSQTCMIYDFSALSLHTFWLLMHHIGKCAHGKVCRERRVHGLEKINQKPDSDN
jgi:hypothetical protein